MCFCSKVSLTTPNICMHITHCSQTKSSNTEKKIELQNNNICIVYLLAHPCRLKNIFFHLKIREGGKNINKMEVKYINFYSDFWKNRVYSPENQKTKEIMA